MLINKQRPVMYHVRQSVAMEDDTLARKKAILITSGLTFLFAFIIGVLYLERYSDVGTMQENKEAIIEGYGFVSTGGLIYN